MSGPYDSEEGFQRLDRAISEHEISKNSSEGSSRRLFYLALPPSVYPSVCKMIKTCCMNKCSVPFQLYSFFLMLFCIFMKFLYLQLTLVDGHGLLLRSHLERTWSLLSNSVLRLESCLMNRRFIVLIIILARNWSKTW